MPKWAWDGVLAIAILANLVMTGLQWQSRRRYQRHYQRLREYGWTTMGVDVSED